MPITSQNSLNSKLEELGKVAVKAVKNQHAWAMATGVRHVIAGGTALLTRGLFGAAMSALDTAKSMAETAYLEWSEKRIEAAGNLLKKTTESMKTLVDTLKGTNVFGVKTDNLLTQLDKEAPTDGNSKFSAYKSFDIDIRPSQLEDVVQNLVQITNTYCDAIKAAIAERTPSGAKMMSRSDSGLRGHWDPVGKAQRSVRGRAVVVGRGKRSARPTSVQWCAL
ncbi:hypothetical protein PINS_up020238 [Pythium insidiosum]|nr:hypothetical protein PINS_up020238 [Pythium insidiosum]